MFRRSFRALLISITGFASATASESISPAERPSAAPRATLSKWQQGVLKAPEIAAKVVSLPDTLPIDQIAISDELNRAGVDKIGYVADLDPNVAPTWGWTRRGDGSDAARVQFVSRGACGLRLRFEDLDPKAEIQIRLFDENGDTVYGPFTSPAPDESGGWWSPTVWDDVVGVELLAPDGLREEAGQPRVARVAYLNLGNGNGCGVAPWPPLSCNNDIQCQGTWTTEGRAVALFHNIKQGVCLRWTGALLNRGPADLAPIFMTSNFACGTAEEADSVEVYWDYTTASCNGSVPATPANQPRNLGAVRLKRHSAADWSLLSLLDAPASSNPLWLGWSSAAWSDNQFAAVIHHPGGSHRRISFGDTGINESLTLCLSISPGGCFTVDSRRVNLTNGPTQLGSTGAPVMDNTGSVRLVASGRETDSPTCIDNSFRQYGGRLDLAIDNLKYVISAGSIASPVYVSSAVAGDPGNDGATERGTLAQPFDAVREATLIVAAGDEVRISPGTYNQQFRIWRPQTLARQGASGSVRIGG